MSGWTTTWERSTRVPPEKARAWWFDLQPDDHDTPEHRAVWKGQPAVRRILERGKDSVTVEDQWGRRPPWRSTLKLEGKDALRVEGGAGKAHGIGTLRFGPEGAGSRLVFDGGIEVKGFFGLLVPLFKRRFQGAFLTDMEAHAKHLEREWKERPW